MRPVHEWLERQASERPDAVALTYAGSQVSYRELNGRANRLARALRDRGVIADMPVGLYLSDGPEAIVGMLAILKAGGGYVPLDPELPAARLARILERARPGMIVTDAPLSASLESAHRTFRIDSERRVVDAHDDDNLGIRVEPDRLCYVMFTSGSTGAPNGVMVTHGNLEHLFDDIGERLAFGPGDVWTQAHTFSFGFSVWEIWGALRHGGRLVIVPRDARADPARLIDIVHAEGVTILSQTPTAFRQNMLTDNARARRADSPVRSVVLSGEAVVREDLRRWFDRCGNDGPRIFNTYAITETGGQVAVREYGRQDLSNGAARLIGQPLRHAEIFILDEDRRPVEAGTAGELYVGGPGVARGYINDADTTSDRFLHLRCNGGEPCRVFRTGDRARWTDGGELEFLGRNDDQVKLRGHRVELGDVETALRAHPGVREAAVKLHRANGSESGRLVAYVVAEDGTAGAAAPDESSPDAPEFWPSVGPYRLYDEFLYDLMSSETLRLEKYRAAFERFARDKVVLDIGTGEHALLARMCIDAGARHVYAVESLETAVKKARDLVSKRGLADRIEVIHGDMATVELPGRVDVCTQGIIGNIGSADGIVPIWNAARRHFNPGCVPVPARCRTMIAAVELPPELRIDPRFGRLAHRYAEHAFKRLGGPFDIRLCVRNFPASGIISDTQVFEDLDFKHRLSTSVGADARFTIAREGRFDGFLLWTVVETVGDDAVDYFSNQQAWLPVFFPVADAGVGVRAGDRLAARWSVEATQGVCPDYRIETTIVGNGQSDRAYSYQSLYKEHALNSTAVHRSLWEHPAAPESDVSSAALKAWLEDRLPDYMMPSAWVELAGLPVNANGKLDRRSLPAPSTARPNIGAAFEAPGSKLESDLVGLWSEILDVDPIGVNDNFFDLGGDSISAVRLTSALQRLLDDPVMLVAIFDAPTIGGLARYLAEHHGPALARRYERGDGESRRDDEAAARNPTAPLSHAQRSFWFLEQLYPQRAGPNEQFVIPIDALDGPAGADPLDVARLADAWTTVIARHEILRTVFRAIDGEPRQVVEPAAPVQLPVTDLSWLDAAARDTALNAAAQAAIDEPFDLHDGPLITARLFRFSAHSHRMLVNAHHIVADGLSIRIIRDELAASYAGSMTGRDPSPVAPDSQYRVFAIRQRRALDADRLRRSLGFWRDALAGAPSEVALPHRAAASVSGRQRRIGFEIDAELAGRLRKLSRDANATMFMTLLAAFRILLFRYSRQDDICIGSPVTCRDSDETASMVGCMVNNVVFRTSTAGEPTFRESLRRERETALAAFQHRDTPFEKVVDALKPVRSFGRHPLFQMLFLFESHRDPDTIADGLTFGLETLDSDRAAYWDLEFSVTNRGDGQAMRGFLGYETGLFDDWFADAIPGHFLNLLAHIATRPDASVSELGLLNDAQIRHMIVDRNATSAPYPETETLATLVSAQAECTPDATALIHDECRISYRELERRANRLARCIAGYGIGPRAVVGLAASRSPELVVGMLAILKTGAAYLPLDPDYPRARLEFMAADADAGLILADAAPASIARGAPDVIRLDEFDWGLPDANDAPFASAAAPGDPCYVLYTSGSTGQPKAATGLHRGAVNRVHWMWREFGFRSSDVFCLRTSPNFVDSVWEIFGALAHGACLAVVSDEDARDPRRLIDRLAEPVGVPGVRSTVNPTVTPRITHVVVVPSILRAMLDAEPDLGRRLPAIHTWISSGEPLAADLLRRFRNKVPHGRLLNTYGTSEIWDATCCDTSDWSPDRGRVPIGRPIANVQAYVLDARMHPVPRGVIGDLYIGGLGLGDGYRNRPDLTASAFIDNPFGPGGLYRTGDLARPVPDGMLECLGRADRQLKLRGLRIEPAEVEAVLRSSPAVGEAAVDLRRGPAGDSQLMAWVESASSDHAPCHADLRRRLRSTLPETMVPSRLMELPALPLTPSGKIDRIALPDPEWSERAGGAFVAPRTETQATIAAIWEKVLGAGRVGLHDGFFDCGGNSLSATRLLARIRASFSVDPGLRALFDEPTVFGLAARVDDLLDSGPALSAPLTPVPRDDVLSLSFGQERLWFLDQLDPRSPAYNIAFTVCLRGRPDVAVLAASLNAILRRHEILRTRFPSVDGKPQQQILSGVTIPLTEEDASAMSDEELEKRFEKVSAQPFDLASGPLLRAHLFCRGHDDYRLLIVIHHIVSDGISNGLLFSEMTAHYDAALSDREPDVPRLDVQYVDYASWQRRYLSGPELDAQLDYWVARLEDAPPALELPTDRPRPAEQHFRGAWIRRSMQAARADALRSLARARGCTLFMVLLGAFKVLMHRYSGQADLVIGTPVAGRGRVEIEPLLGLFINTLALRTDLSGNPRFTDLLDRVRRVTLEAQAHQDLPFERLVDALRPDRTLSRAPVFQVMFNLTPIPDRAPKHCATVRGLDMRMDRLIDHGVSTFDLTLSVGEHADGLELIYEYDRDLFDRETIARMADHYSRLLDGILLAPEKEIGALPMLTSGEKRLLCEEWNPPAPAVMPDADPRAVHRLFEAHADRNPDAVAVVDGARVFTYAELDRHANRLARHLRSVGVGPEDIVGICLPQTAETLIAVLGVLKAGGAYAPLEPGYPRRRLADLVTATGPRAIVACDSVAGRLPEVEAPVTRLDLDADEFAMLPCSRPADISKPEHLAYVLFTSGSTGQPKGVMVTHANLISANRAWSAAYDLSERDRHLQMATFAFDVFTGDWVRALCSGARLIVCPRDHLLEPDRLYALMRDEGITVAEFVPAVMRGLVNHVETRGGDLSFMRLLVVGSDVWFGPEYQALKRLCGDDTRVVNSYGTAETTIDSAFFEAVDASTAGARDGPVAIGRPFDNSRIYICDENLEMAPIGVPGELCVGGAGVGRGYLDRPDLTSERFVADPFAGTGRLYRTGDRARYRPDGMLELLGRLDQQIKLRGFRVEPAEIEAVIGGHVSVSAVAVALRDHPERGSALVAYVVGHAGDEPDPDSDALRVHVRAQLPDYMVPALFMPIPRLPLSANGKLDRRSLPVPDWSHQAGASPAVPRSPVESAICGLFGEVLGLTQVGIHDDFFGHGGHSLLAAQLVARIRDALDVELPLKTLFDAPTPADLTSALTRHRDHSAARLRPRACGAAVPASYAQQRLWFLDQLEPGSAAYHLHWCLRLSGPLDLEALQAAVDAIVDRHEGLRTTFADRDGEPVQIIADRTNVTVDVVPAAGNGAGLEAKIVERVATPFDLSAGPLLRITALRISEQDHALLLVIHHIVADGWSMSVLCDELAVAYNAFTQGRSPDWPALAVQYADFAVWQRESLAGAELERQLGYWSAQLDGAPALVQLSIDRPRSDAQTYRGAWSTRELSPDVGAGLHELARREGCTLFMLLLAAFDAVLGRYAGTEDIVVGTPIAGRGQTELEKLIGFFVNTLALRTSLVGDPSFAELIARVKKVALDAYAHQDLPFEKLVEALNPVRDRSYTPIVQVLIAVHNQPPVDLQLTGLDVQPLHVENETAKFDLSLHVSESSAGMTLAFAYNSDLFDADTIDALASCYEALLGEVMRNPELSLGELTSLAGLASPGKPAEPEQWAVPVSFAQQRLWFLDQLEGASSAYNVKLPVRLYGELDLDCMRRAVELLIRRHESLRTTFGFRDGAPVQIVRSQLESPLDVLDMIGATSEEAGAKAAALAGAPFHLATGPLIRVHVLQLAKDEHLLLLVAHHIVSDAWSTSVMFRDLAAAYDAYAAGETPRLPDLPVQYADYAAWQREWFEGDDLDRQIRYWETQLAGAPPALDLPTDRNRPARQTYNGSRVSRQLGAAMTSALRGLAQQESCTLFMVLLTAFDVLLGRYSGQEDILVGSPIAGRRRTELEGLVGLFVNTLVFRADLSGDPSYRSLLAQVRRTALDAYANQDLPFEKLVEVLQPVRDLSRSPLFQVMFIHQNAPWEAQPIRGLEVSPGAIAPGETAKFDITFSSTEYEGELYLNFEYNTDLYDEQTIERLAIGLESMLESVTANPDQRIGALSVEPGGQIDTGLADSNRTACALPAVRSVHGLIDAQVLRTPAAVALECGQKNWSYAELDTRARALAQKLHKHLVDKECSLVGLCLERSPGLVSAALGILKAGAAFLPLDPAYPPERLHFMLDDSGAGIVITQSSLLDRVGDYAGTIVCVDDEGDVAAVIPGAGGTKPGATDADLAYVIYTSGSTGNPKGVCIPHRAVVNFLASMTREPGLDGSDRMLAVTTPCFDISILELFGPLTVGGTVIIAPAEVAADGLALGRLIDETAPSVMQATPATWRMLLDAGWRGVDGLKMLCGGEALDRSLAGRLLTAGSELWNMYGPTETTIWSTCQRIFDAGAPVGIGRPIANTRVHVLNSNMRPVPVGVAGELYIGGVGLARGYLGQPALTGERFVADPFVAGQRLYRTGDRARCRVDGTLELLGRTDDQIKLRGFRIELGEIEAAVRAHEAIGDCAVALREDPARGPTLVAFCVPAGADGIDTFALRADLKRRLPDYMVPALFMGAAALPLTANGKLDRRHLPAPDWALAAHHRRVAPRTPVESALCELFGEVLGLDEIGVHDDFFALGGHSLLATQLVARIRDALDVELSLLALFESPTVAGLAAKCAGAPVAGEFVSLRSRPSDTRDLVPASYMQQRLWFLDRLDPGNPVYNLAWPLRLTGDVDVDALERALIDVVRRHEALRTTFVEDDGAPMQVIADEPAISIESESLRIAEHPDDRRRLDARLADLAKRPFDLRAGPLMRAHLVQLGARDHVLLVVIHHIVADGWSMSVLFRELCEAYAARRRGVDPNLPALPVQYADYALWQREWLSGAELDRQLDYWRTQLDDAPPVLELPHERRRPTQPAYRGARLSRRIDAALAGRLHALGRIEGCTLFMVLLAAFDVVLGRFAGQEDVVVGTPIAGRGRTELENLIGFFVNTLVMRTDLSGNPRFGELLARVRRTALGAYAHQELPFEKLVDQLRPERDTGYPPVFQVMFNFHNEPGRSERGQAVELDGLDVTPFGIDRGTAKFDLSVALTETGDGLFGTWEYNADLFDEDMVEALATCYTTVLEQVSWAPESRLSELAAPGESPAQHATPPATATLVDGFAAQVARNPNDLAVQSARFAWSYGELNARANAIAQALRSGNAAPDGGRVGLMCGHDAELLAGLLGILKAGAAYVPLELELPAARLTARIAHARVRAIVADGARLDRARALVADTLPVIGVDAAAVGEDPDRVLRPDSPAYILYTSGTTGRPKGVVQTHGGASQNIAAYSQGLGLRGGDRLSWLSGYGYDAAVQDIFGALVNGATVCPVDVREADARDVVAAVVDAGVTVLHATPTLYRHLFGAELNCTHDLSRIRSVVLGGEEARRADFELFKARFAPGTAFVNGFGLTEATVGLQFIADHDSRLPGQVVPVGRAVAGIDVQLLDRDGRPSWIGEITLTGPGVAHGYWRQTELGRRRFAGVGGVRRYRTGDLGRRLPDGQIAWVGRMDDQVKIRGLRVEPGEIEAALSECDAVNECAVVVDRGIADEPRLVAYVVSGAGCSSPDELRARAAERLPAQMVPLAFEFLASLPRRANGKLDRARLPAPAWGRGAERVPVPARTELEAVLVEVWRDVLGLDEIGVHEDFFALGGHSLLATRLVSRLRDRLKLEVPLFSVFEYPTVAGLADAIGRGAMSDAGVLPDLGRRDGDPSPEPAI